MDTPPRGHKYSHIFIIYFFIIFGSVMPLDGYFFLTELLYFRVVPESSEIAPTCLILPHLSYFFINKKITKKKKGVILKRIMNVRKTSLYFTYIAFLVKNNSLGY